MFAFIVPEGVSSDEIDFAFSYRSTASSIGAIIEIATVPAAGPSQIEHDYVIQADFGVYQLCFGIDDPSVNHQRGNLTVTVEAFIAGT